MNKAIVQQMFQDVWKSANPDPKNILKYFSSNFIQEIDSKSYTRTEFLHNLGVLKKTTLAIDIAIKSLQEIGHTVFSNHIIRLSFHDGTTNLIHVIASFQLENHQITSSDELTFVEQPTSSYLH
ncbi:hypothetical protein GCM10023231_02070 [Olivibacter ginsenosidimutans]|uniref:Nuclear transport factor 2 family protein n=1 Tax=Olivibacter ginsenosidimutans TaxID=1176537 RepID=A0ABP9AD78_9SPHI